MPSIYDRKRLAKRLKTRERRAQRRMLLEQAYLSENDSSGNTVPETSRTNGVTLWNRQSSSSNTALPSFVQPEVNNEDNHCSNDITTAFWEEEININIPAITQLNEEEDPLALPDGEPKGGFVREGEEHCGIPSNNKESDDDSVIVKTEPQHGEAPDGGTTSDEDNAMVEEAETDAATVTPVFPSTSKGNFSSVNDGPRHGSEKPNTVTKQVKSSACKNKVPTHMCVICDETFGTSFKLSEHHVDHGIQREIRCQICQRIFRTFRDLQTHVSDYYFNKLILVRVTESGSQFQCPICEIVFVTKYSLKCHGRTHEVSDDFVCKICVQGFPSFNTLVSHTRRHKSATHQCTICNQDFKERKTAISHVLEKHKDDFETCCEFCGNRFRTVEDLEIHREQFHAIDIKWVNKFQTPRMVKLKEALNKKKQSVAVQESSRLKSATETEKTGGRKKAAPSLERKITVTRREPSALVSCQRCGKTVQKGLMKSHQATIKCRFLLVFSCQTCGKKFRGRRSLKTHEQQHAGFQCPFCPSPQRRYSVNASLLRHLSVCHLKPEGFVEFNVPPDAERKYVCEKCNASYTTSEALKEHIIYHGIPDFQCPDCPHKFFTNYQLFRHKVKEHGRYRFKLADGRSIMCHQCPSTFTSRSGYLRHKIVAHSETPSSVLCEVCGKSFKFRDLLSRHVRKVHGKNKQSLTTNPALSVS